MVDLLITNGGIVTMDDQRRVIPEGGVAVQDGTIVAVGPTEEIESTYTADRVIDASGTAVIPGLIDTHTHISSILLRGGNTANRTLYDWLFNVTKPARAQMTTDEHAIASELFCREATEAGITTIVESAVGGGSGYSDEIVDAKMDVYDRAGIRHIFAQSFIDQSMETELREYVERLMATEPAVDAPSGALVDTQDALDNAERLMNKYHGTRDGRQEVWSGPLSPRSTTVEGLRGAYALAEEYDAMTTTHVSETTHEESAVGGDHQSMVEYLNDVSYLGERSLLAHCVHVSDRDIRLLAETGTKVAHNICSNLALGAGVAPVERMRAYGVTVGIGTDNATTSDAIDMLGDARLALFAQRGIHQDPTIIEPVDVLEMVTIDAAEAIGKAETIGSLEPGKQADIGIVNLDHPTGTPRYDLQSALIFQAHRERFETVICAGEIIVDGPDRTDRYRDDLLNAATHASEDIIRRTGVIETFDGIE